MKEVLFISERSPHTGERGFRAVVCRVLPWITIALVGWALLSSIPQPAWSGVTIAVTPTRIPLSMAPEDSQTLEVTLINQGTEEVDLKPRVMALAEGTKGEPLLTEDSTCAWFSPRMQSLHLMPSESGPFAFTATVPDGVSPGLYHFTLSFELLKEEGAGIGLTGGLAVLVDLEVLEGEAAGTSGFPTALLVTIAVLAALFLGSLAIRVAHTRRRGSNGVGADGMGGQGR
jgi:hypothetical protein